MPLHPTPESPNTCPRWGNREGTQLRTKKQGVSPSLPSRRSPVIAKAMRRDGKEGDRTKSTSTPLSLERKKLTPFQKLAQQREQFLKSNPLTLDHCINCLSQNSKSLTKKKYNHRNAKTVCNPLLNKDYAHSRTSNALATHRSHDELIPLHQDTSRHQIVTPSKRPTSMHVHSSPEKPRP